MNEIEQKVEKIKRLLEHNRQALFAEECLTTVLEEEVFFHPGTRLTAQHAFKTYNVRRGVQEEVTNANISGYGPLLSALERNLTSGNVDVVICKIIHEFTYIIFTNEDISKFFGILKSKESGFISYEQFIIKNEEKGIQNESVRLYQSKVIKK